MNKKKLTLSSIGNGAAEEQFQRELAVVRRNLEDPSTPPDKPRQITLTITFLADEHRQMFPYNIKATSKLVPQEPFVGLSEIDTKNPDCLLETTPVQTSLDDYDR